MFVITADQVGSRERPDGAPAQIAQLVERFGDRLVLPPDQTAGDEIQLLADSADTALGIILQLTRSTSWSVGLGVGEMRRPIPAAARLATGSAFFAARDAVTAAKRSDTRFALRAAPLVGARAGEHVEALIQLLLLLRERRSEAGWEVVDLMSTGQRQKDIAAVLDISPAAVSMRLRTAGWRAEEAAIPALIELLRELDGASAHTAPASIG